MVRAIAIDELTEDRKAFKETGGVSSNNRSLGFVPAFLDSETGVIYISRNPNGTLAPCHCLEGLPEALIACRDDQGRVLAVKVSVIAGFERGGYFFTREQAAIFVAAEEA